MLRYFADRHGISGEFRVAPRPEDGMRRGGLPPQVELDSPEEGLGGFQGFWP
jgi:hypothetical protein